MCVSCEVYSDLGVGSHNASAGVNHDAGVCVFVCGGVFVCGVRSIINDMDVRSHNEKGQREWTMMLRCGVGVCVCGCVCVCGRGEV